MILRIVVINDTGAMMKELGNGTTLNEVLKDFNDTLYESMTKVGHPNRLELQKYMPEEKVWHKVEEEDLV